MGEVKMLATEARSTPGCPALCAGEGTSHPEPLDVRTWNMFSRQVESPYISWIKANSSSSACKLPTCRHTDIMDPVKRIPVKNVSHRKELMMCRKTI
jgi:hypothetical protein